MIDYWLRFTRTVAPAADVEVLTLAEAKAQVRVDEADDDDALQDAIDAAVEMIDGPAGIGVCLITQSWRLSLDAWPCGGVIELLLGPVQSIASVTYVDTAGVTQTLDPSAYLLDTDKKPARLVPAYNTSWPAARCQPGAIKITFAAGYGAAADAVPKPIKSALKLLVADLYENREGTVIDASRVTLVENPTLRTLLANYGPRLA